MKSRDGQVVKLCPYFTFIHQYCQYEGMELPASCDYHISSLLFTATRETENIFSQSNFPEHFPSSYLPLPYHSSQAKSKNTVFIFQDFSFVLHFLHMRSAFLMCILSDLKKVSLEGGYDQVSWSAIREEGKFCDILTCF